MERDDSSELIGEIVRYCFEKKDYALWEIICLYAEKVFQRKKCCSRKIQKIGDEFVLLEEEQEE